VSGQPQAPALLFSGKGTEAVIGQEAVWTLALSACFQEHKDLDRPLIALLSLVQHSLLGQGMLILCGPVGLICPPFQNDGILLKHIQACEIHRNVGQGSSVLERCVMAICKELTDVSTECCCIFKNVLRSSESSVTVYQSIRRSCQKDLDLHELSILAITIPPPVGGTKFLAIHACNPPVPRTA
jgi:hypothetical protein